MQRLATRILFVVAGFVLVVAVLLVTKSRSVRTEASGPAPTAADLSIKDVELQEESAGGGHWRLLADQTPGFDQEGGAALRKGTGYVKDKEKNWTIGGGGGDRLKESKKPERRGKVGPTSHDGLRPETTGLARVWAGGRPWA